MRRSFCVISGLVLVLGSSPAQAQDAAGCSDHPALSRYPGSVLEWCKTENYMPYKIPVGPVTGYRTVGEWIETEGRVTRDFYSLRGGERTHSEVHKNFSDALEKAGFEIIAKGLFPARNVAKDVGGGSWQGLFYGANPWAGGAVGKLVVGTSSSGGTGVVFGKKQRAEDTIYVLVSLEQHSSNEVAVLVDVVETKEAETGLVTANAEAMGKDIDEYGRTVLVGLFFDHDKATLKPESKPALDEIAKLLASRGDKKFYVVGHTDATGAFSYNMRLSADRAETVRSKLVKEYSVVSDRLQAAGVGPLSPIFTNTSDGGREKNRRVELVEQ